MMPKSVKRFSDDIMLFHLILNCPQPPGCGVKRTRHRFGQRV
jgi:hypothetical protein